MHVPKGSLPDALKQFVTARHRPRLHPFVVCVVRLKEAGLRVRASMNIPHRTLTRGLVPVGKLRRTHADRGNHVNRPVSLAETGRRKVQFEAMKPLGKLRKLFSAGTRAAVVLRASKASGRMMSHHTVNLLSPQSHLAFPI